MVSVKYDSRTTDDKLVQIAVRLVEHGEVGLRRKIVEEIEQCQARNACAVFEHIDGLLLVEGELFVNGLEEGYERRSIYSSGTRSSSRENTQRTNTGG